MGNALRFKGDEWRVPRIAVIFKWTVLSASEKTKSAIPMHGYYMTLVLILDDVDRGCVLT